MPSSVLYAYVQKKKEELPIDAYGLHRDNQTAELFCTILSYFVFSNLVSLSPFAPRNKTYGNIVLKLRILPGFGLQSAALE